MKARFFPHQSDFRKWLEENYAIEKELVVGFYKVNSGKPSLTWSESVDQALCFGWIDGIRKSIDNESYCIRFTPRKPTSIWSTVNINKMEEMIPKGLVQEAGLLAYEKRKDDKSRIYTYEQVEIELSSIIEEKFKDDQTAWEFFQKQPPYYRKLMTGWIVRAKQEKTRFSRLEKLINASRDGKRL
ncbi:YdeI family protein [Emticicia sp. BO119]|uniref:YdeI/OmpD-associated family protein n=1 Tax=Emticicia sp. BO119 TaxID=2757768 RepID=UPI0015F122F8|nr:YdeI/OmpD-associated family protein [Emticicia sp. BO119]MBA4853644.1 YdeI/OmpD-associated family protein [Emticicia sp. BO119]